jgi:hypothetical protein
MLRAQPSQVTIRANAMKILEERWSHLWPQAGTELCVCSWCAKMIGRDERDPIWEDHIEYCIGCEVCEMPVRMWKADPDRLQEIRELRFHPNYVNEIIVTKTEREYRVTCR